MLYSPPRLTHAARRPLHRDFLVAADLAQTPERANSEAIVIMTEAEEIAVAHPDAAAVAETEPKRPRVGGTMPLELKGKIETSLVELGEVEACGPYVFFWCPLRARCAWGPPCNAWSAEVQETAQEGTRTCAGAGGSSP